MLIFSVLFQIDRMPRRARENNKKTFKSWEGLDGLIDGRYWSVQACKIQCVNCLCAVAGYLTSEFNTAKPRCVDI